MAPICVKLPSMNERSGGDLAFVDSADSFGFDFQVRAFPRDRCGRQARLSLIGTVERGDQSVFGIDDVKNDAKLDRRRGRAFPSTRHRCLKASPVCARS